MTAASAEAERVLLLTTEQTPRATSAAGGT